VITLRRGVRVWGRCHDPQILSQYAGWRTVDLLGAAEQGRAATIYTYTGANFTSFGILDSTPLPAGTYTTSMNVTGSFTLQDPLLQNLSNANITADILSFSFFDGRNTITKADATAFTFFVNTDALANISAWGIFVRRDDPGFSIPTVGSQRREHFIKRVF
jgi:hypothetical protein